MSRWRWILLAVLTIAGATWPLLSRAQPHGQPAPTTTTVPGTVARTAPGAAAKPESGKPESGEAAESEDHPPAAINWLDGPFLGSKQPPFIATILNFALLIGIYYYFGKKPIAAALAARRANVVREIEEAQRMKREAEERAKLYQAKLGTLEEELAMARQSLVEAGRGEKERIIKEAEEKAGRMQRDAEFLIDQEMKQLRQDVWRDTVNLATSAAEELLRKRITPADQERIAEDYLADLVGRNKSIVPPPPRPVGGAS